MKKKVILVIIPIKVILFYSVCQYCYDIIYCDKSFCNYYYLRSWIEAKKSTFCENAKESDVLKWKCITNMNL